MLVEANKIIERVVFDCNIFLQAIANPDGPSGACFAAAISGIIHLAISAEIMSEFTEVAARPAVRKKLSLSEEQVEAFLQKILAVSDYIPIVPAIFNHPIDPKDNIYVDLAIAVSATVITSRDLDLRRLMDVKNQLGHDFVQKYPSIKILTPIQLLERIRDS